MILEFREIADAGTLAKERVILTVSTAGDVGHYSLYRAKNDPDVEDGVLSGRVEAFWFPDQKVKVGDLVVLYSKDGEESAKRLHGGATTYFYYWGQTRSIWGKADHRAVLVNSGDWSIFSGDRGGN
jgi:hypothetical protein